MKTKKQINVFVENEFNDWKLNKNTVKSYVKKILSYYIDNLFEQSVLNNIKFDKISLDILFCDSEKTLELNKNYREKNTPADIITFAIFADSNEKFVLDNEINLGEIVIALDKVIERVNKDISHSENKEQELYFLLSHGLLHLLGFDHQSENEYNFVIEQQKKALESINYDKI